MLDLLAGPPGELEVRALEVPLPVNKEDLLLEADVVMSPLEATAL